MNAITLLSQMSRSAAVGGQSFSIILIISCLVVGLGMTIFFFSRYENVHQTGFLSFMVEQVEVFLLGVYMVERLLFGQLSKLMSS